VIRVWKEKLRRTGFVTLDRLLARLHANKTELLMVLQRPEIPLHTNGSENDIRCQVTRRKVSAGTRSDTGRDCRDAFSATSSLRVPDNGSPSTVGRAGGFGFRAVPSDPLLPPHLP
jgi:hypothetical protein